METKMNLTKYMYKLNRYVNLVTPECLINFKKKNAKLDKLIGWLGLDMAEIKSCADLQKNISSFPQSDYQLLDILAMGKYGIALLLEKYTDLFVLKLIKYEPNINQWSPENERQMHDIFYNSGLTVTVHTLLITENIYYILQDFAGITLRDVFFTILINKKLSKREKKKFDAQGELYKIWAILKPMLKILVNKNLTHGDLHIQNIMMNDKNKLHFIDFGKSSNIKHHIRLDCSAILRSIRLFEDEFRNNEHLAQAYLYDGKNGFFTVFFTKKINTWLESLNILRVTGSKEFMPLLTEYENEFRKQHVKVQATKTQQRLSSQRAILNSRSPPKSSELEESSKRVKTYN